MASSSHIVPSTESSSSISLSSSTNESSSDGDHESVSQRYRKGIRNKMNLLIVPQMLTLIKQPVF